MSSKTKKLLQQIGMWFGLAVLVFVSVRAKKANDLNKSGIAKNVADEIKSLFQA